MTRTPTPFEIPARHSLVALTADAIRKAIGNDSWKEYLPTERQLCDIFQVSRPTIRKSLHLLAQEGMIDIRPGQGTRLLANSRAQVPRQNRLVGLITHTPVTEMGVTYKSISEVSTHLANQGFSTELIVCKSHGSSASRQIEKFLQRNRVVCCVLLSVSKELQHWFCAQSVPALVVGSCHPEVRLPSLDFDCRAICRHAAGVFLKKGHRQIALIVPNFGLAGDLASEVGFREAAEGRRNQAGNHFTVIRHDGTADGIAAKLDVLYRSPRAPTALLVANAYEVFIILMYLLKHSVPVPDAVSLIARDHDHVFEIVRPSISHYAPRPGAFEHRLSRLMLQMVNQRYVAPEPRLIFPRFFPGETVRDLKQPI